MYANSLSSSVHVPGETTRVRVKPVPVWRILRRRPPIGGYSLAVVSVVLAFLLRLLVDRWLGDQSPYLLFVVAVAVTGLYAGVLPALFAAALGTVVAYFCFVPPRYEWGFAGISDAVGFGVYVLAVAGVILLTHARNRAAQKAEQHRIQAEEILVKTERFLAAGQMASLLAHEINNPLAALTNVMFLLNRQPTGSGTQELVSKGTDALTRINRIAATTMGLFFEKDTPGSVHVCEIADEVIETLTAMDRFKHIEWARDFKCNTSVVASPPRIRQLIASLLTNAMESGASVVRVRIRMGLDWRRHGRNGIRITIADDGCGIQNELRERVFEPFFSTKAEKASGLGLWACRAIVLRNDGRMTIRSGVTGPRKGTSVSVFLPIIN